MSVIVTSRSRLLSTDEWSSWVDVTTAPPYVDTELIQYNSSNSVSMNISTMTRNVVTSSTFEVTGDGVFDKLMETVTRHIDAQYRANKITGKEYAVAYTAMVQIVISEAMAFTLKKDMVAEELSSAYVGRVKADKEVALMGLDNVLAGIKQGKNGDTSYVYTPQYYKV